jgi:hypothetical protein
MKNLWLAVLALSLPAFVVAHAPASSPTKVTPPRLLKVPGRETASPGTSVQGADGTDLDVEESVQAPEADRMAIFTDPALFEAVKKAKKAERTVGTFFWHSANGLDYCHYRDMEGDHWYGWDEDGKMYWVLWRGNRYWWKDTFAGLWLYFDRGYWWRGDGQKDGQAQVYIDGEYYLCGRDGGILADEGQDGQGLINSGQGRFRGDYHGGHGGHGRRQEGGQGQGSRPGQGEGSPNAPSPGGAQAP